MGTKGHLACPRICKGWVAVCISFGSGCFCDDDHEDYEEVQQQNDNGDKW